MRLLFLLFWLSGFISASSAQNCYTPMNPYVVGITPVAATVNWDAMPNATAYEVNYRPMNAPSTLPWTSLPTNTNSLSITGLTPSTMYSAQIRSVCGPDFSNYTVNVDFSTQSCVPPGGLTASNLTANTADLQWNVAQGASAYQFLYRVAVTNPGAWNTIPVSGTSYQLTGLTANILYAARLLSDCGGNLSDTSKVYYFSTNPCSVPSHLIITAQTASSISLSWDAVPNATQYNVQYRLVGNNTWSSVNSNTNDKTITGLSGNSLYEFQVRSRCSQNEYSAYTLTINGFTLPCAMPENAVISNVTVNSVTVGWNNTVGSTQYRVEYKKEVDPNWTTVNATTTTKTINNLDPDTDYQVRVRSKCTGNQYSAYSELIKFRTKTCVMPERPRIAEVGVHSARIEWNPTINATRYQLDYKSNSNPWTTITTTDTFRVLNNLLQDEVYQVRLRAQCGNGIYSDYPDTIYVVVNSCTPPSYFRNETFSYNSATFTWDTTDHANQYRFEYKKMSEVAWQTRNVNATYFTINNLEQATVYEARISTRCGNNLFSPVGRIIRFRTDVCEIPFNVLIDSVDYRYIDLSWFDVNASSYEVHYKLNTDQSWSTKNSNNPSVRLNQLMSDAVYQVKVRAKCGANVYSEFSPMLVIPTLRCNQPILAIIDTIASNRIRISWPPVEGRINGYELSYSQVGDSSYITRNTQDTFIVLNIDLAESWNFRLRTRCGGGVFSDALLFNPNSPSGANRCEIDKVSFDSRDCGSILKFNCILPIWDNRNAHIIRVFDSNNQLMQEARFGIKKPIGSSTPPIYQHIINFRSLNPFNLDPNEGDLTLDDATVYPTGVYRLCVVLNSSAGVIDTCQFCLHICLPFGLPEVTPISTPILAGCGVNEWELSVQNDPNKCPTLEGYTVSYTWTRREGNRSILIGSTPRIRVKPTVPTTYQVEVFDIYGCKKYAEITVVPNEYNPGLEKNCGRDICQGETYTAIFSFSGQNEIPRCLLNDKIYFNFDYEERTDSPTPHTYILRIIPGEYKVGLNVIEFTRYDYDNGCIWTDSCVFEVFPSLNASITANPNTPIPIGGNVSLNVNATGGKPPYTYNWTPINYASGILSPNNTSSIIANNITANTEFCVEIRDAVGCFTKVCRLVSVEECPTACCSITVSETNDLCRRNQYRLCVSGDNEQYTQYQWDIPWINNGMGGIIVTNTPCLDIEIPAGWFGSNRQISVIGFTGSMPSSCRSAIGIFEIGNEFPGTLVCQFSTSRELLVALNIPFGNNDPFPTITPAVWGAGTIVFQNVFIVNTPVRFRNMRLEVAPNQVINVNRGGRLWLDKCHAYGQQGQEWTGIRTVGNANSNNQPIVELDSTTIQHANIGIDASGATSFDVNRSLVRVDSSCLNENRVHIRMFHNPARWTNLRVSNFMPTPLLLRADSFTCIHALPTTTDDFTDVAIWVRGNNSIQIGSEGYAFGNRNWTSNTNRINRADVGIRSENSTTLINNFLFEDLIPVNTNVVTGLPTGVEILPDVSGNNRPVFVGTQSQNIFFPRSPNKMERGIFITGTSANVDVISNIFINLHNNTAIGGRAATGVWLADLNQSTIQVEDNFFFGIERGIFSERTILGDPATNILVDGNFFNGYQNGFHARNSGDALYTTTISNNNFWDNVTFQQNVIGPNIWDSGIIMYGLPGSTMANNATEILDNRFTGAGNFAVSLIYSHRLANGQGGVLIQGNTVLPDAGKSYDVGLNIAQNVGGTRILDNTIRIIPTGFPDNSGANRHGIHLYDTRDNEIRCNRVRGAKEGVRAWRNCAPSHLAYNLIGSCNEGIRLMDNGIIGNQGNGSFSRPGDNNLPNSNYNFWGNCNFAAYAVNTDGSNQIVTTTIDFRPPYYTDPIANNMPSDGFNSNPLGFTPAPNYNQLMDYSQAGCDIVNALTYFNFTSANESQTHNGAIDNYERVVKGYQIVGPHAESINYMARYHLLEVLSSADRYPTETSTLLDSFLNANRSDVPAMLITTDRLIPLNRTQAKMLNEQIEPTNTIEANMKTFNRIYIDWLERHSYTSADYATLVLIADQCAITGGKAVAQARNLRASWEGTARWYDDTCTGSNAPQPKKETVKSVEHHQINIYPNPANVSVQVRYDLSREASALTIVNPLGMEVERKPVHGKKGNETVATGHLPAGIYLLQIRDAHHQVLSVQKLIIVK